MIIKPIKKKIYTLRPYRMDDAPRLVKAFNKRSVSRWLESVSLPYLESDARKRIKKALAEQKKVCPETVIFVIEIDGVLAGVIGISNISRGHALELGYWLDSVYWGKGVMSDVIKTICHYSFQEFKVHRIQAEVFVGNIGSEKVLLKNGFAYEGLMRKAAKKNNRFYDCRLFAKIR